MNVAHTALVLPTPDGFQNLLKGADAAGVLEQVGQDSVFFGR